MGQPVKLSEELVLDARLVGETMERSIAGQIEHWAKLGRGMESLLHAPEAIRLKRQGESRPLSALLSSVDTGEGRDRLDSHLEALPFPHFEPAVGRRGFLVKIDEDGSRTIGRFVNRKFRAVRRK